MFYIILIKNTYYKHFYVILFLIGFINDGSAINQSKVFHFEGFPDPHPTVYYGPRLLNFKKFLTPRLLKPHVY